LEKSQNFAQKSKFGSKIKISLEKLKFWEKILGNKNLNLIFTKYFTLVTNCFEIFCPVYENTVRREFWNIYLFSNYLKFTNWASLRAFFVIQEGT